MKTVFLLVCTFLFSGLYAQSTDMTNARMGRILATEADSVAGSDGNWQVILEQRMLFVITDPAANRMRIFTPVISSEDVDEKLMRAMLIANFHTALDAKYSLYEGFVISTFTHPLAELREHQFIDALRQVARLADNFGTTFSSTDLFFGGGREPTPDAPPKRKKRATKKS